MERQIWCLGSVLAAVLSIISCAGYNPKSMQMNSEVNSQEAPVVSITTEHQEWDTQDGECVLLEAYQDTVTVENEGFDNLQAALTEYYAPIDEKEYEGLRQYAQETYENFKEGKDNKSYKTGSFYTHSTWQETWPRRCDSNVISFEEYYGAFLGVGTTPVFSGATFEVETGKKLELSDMIQDEGFYEAASDYVIDWFLRTGRFTESADWMKECVTATFAEDEPIHWYLNGVGIVIIYNNNILPMETARVTLPYGLFSEYIKEEYTNPHMEFIAEISENEDIAGMFGLKQQGIEITFDEEKDGFIYVTIGDVREIAGVGKVGDAYAVRRGNGRSFLIFEVLDEDVDTLCVYEVTGGNIKKCDEKVEAYFDNSFWGTERIGIRLTVHALGTHTGYMDFMWDEEGRLVAAEEAYAVEAAWNLVVRKEIPVIMGGVEAIIDTGEEITVTGINMEENIYYFQVVDSGECGEIHYEEAQKGRMIDGISEFEYFENLNYAG